LLGLINYATCAIKEKQIETKSQHMGYDLLSRLILSVLYVVNQNQLLKSSLVT